MSITVKVTEQMRQEAQNYANLSHDFTSRNHDFHAGGATIASQKMYEGKIGEKAFRALLIEYGISFKEDSTNHDEADLYDFLVGNLKIDIKTRTEDYQTRTLEMVEQFTRRPKDIYVGARYRRELATVEFYGYIEAEELKNANPAQGFGYKTNYWASDDQMKPIEDLLSLLSKL